MLYNSQAKLLPVITGNNFIFQKPVSQDVNMFDIDIMPKYFPTALRIYACFDTAGILRVVRKYQGVESVEDMNLGNDLKANAAYIFDIIVDLGMTINLRYTVGPMLAKYVTVVEIPTIQ